MRVDCRIDPACRDPHAVIQIDRMTPAIQEAIALLEQEGREESLLFGQREGRTYLIEPESIEVIRTEGRELILYDRQKARFRLSRTLYELEELLGDRFLRISKSALVNIRRISHVEAGFNGTMTLVMKNGVEESISRSFRKPFKERLGLA